MRTFLPKHQNNERFFRIQYNLPSKLSFPKITHIHIKISPVLVSRVCVGSSPCSWSPFSLKALSAVVNSSVCICVVTLTAHGFFFKGWMGLFSSRFPRNWRHTIFQGFLTGNWSGVSVTLYFKDADRQSLRFTMTSLVSMRLCAHICCVLLVCFGSLCTGAKPPTSWTGSTSIIKQYAQVQKKSKPNHARSFNKKTIKIYTCSKSDRRASVSVA